MDNSRDRIWTPTNPALSDNMDSTPFDETSVEPFWTSKDLTGSAHASNDIVQEKEHITFVPDHNRPKLGLEMKTKRKMIRKEQWDPLKPVVERLYVKEGWTLRQVAEYLGEHHDLNPTKRQLLRRISEWGIEKNVKQQERRAILQSLDSHENMGDFDKGMLGRRKFNKAKIERWRRIEGAIGVRLPAGLNNIPGAFNSSSYHTRGDNSGHSFVELPNWYEAVNEISFCGASLPESEVHQEQILNPWLAVDFIGSPRLTGFIGCLMLELGDELEALDLSALDREEDGEEDALISTYEGCKTLLPNGSQDSSTTTSQGSFYIAALIAPSPKHRRSQMPGPLDELSPFPQPQKRMILLPTPETGHLLHLSSLKMKELECKTKIKNVGLLDRAEMIDLVENMRSIAQRHYQLDNFQLAENWWRRVVTYSRKISEYPLVKVLEACLWVIDNHRLRGKPIEARDLHQGVHEKMLSLFHPEHRIILFSKRILGSIFCDLGEYGSQEQQHRELVQICLLKYGARNEFLVCLLAFLGLTLFSSGKFKEAETILCLHIQLDREVSGYEDKCQADRENTFSALCNLAELLNCQERFGESSKILDFAEEQFKDLVKPGSFYGNRFCRRKAESLYAKGDLLGCEELLRTTLKHTSSSIGWDAVNSMEKLAELLEDTNRGIEALSWRERIFLMEIQLCGVEHRWSREGCETLGFCYANLGRYDDAVYHFRQTIEKLSLDQEVSPESRSAYAGTLHEWIRKVEEMEGKQRL